MKKRILAAACLAAVALPGGTTAALAHEPASAAQPVVRPVDAMFPTARAIPDSREATGHVLAHGRIIDTAGSPVAGAELVLQALPSRATRRSVPVGETYALLPVARTVTDADGQYVLRADMDSRLRSRRDPEGVSFRFEIVTADRHLVQDLQADHDGGGWINPGSSVAAERRTAKTGKDATEHNRVDLTVDLESGSTLPQRLAESGGSEAPAGRDHDILGCTSERSLPSKTGSQVVATAIAANGVKISTKYMNSATTSTGTGISYNGGVTFSQNATRSRTSNFTANFYDRTAPSGGTINKEYRVTWRHLVSDRHCDTDSGGPLYQVQVFTDPDIATGGATDTNSRYADFTCATANRARANVSSISTTSATATNYGSAFSINPVGKGGFSGSSRSGYNSSTKITYTFNSTNGGYWCGIDNVPTAAGRTKAWK